MYQLGINITMVMTTMKNTKKRERSNEAPKTKKRQARAAVTQLVPAGLHIQEKGRRKM